MPLFSGFMYAAIGSYIARAWRLFEIRFETYPPLWGPWLLAVLSYVNSSATTTSRTSAGGCSRSRWCCSAARWFQFTPDLKPRRMPMLLGFLLVALFIWFAENLGTFTATWIYPNQRHGWSLVPIGKLGAWYLLIMLSFVLVSLVHRPRAPGEGEHTNPLVSDTKNPLIPAKAGTQVFCVSKAPIPSRQPRPAQLRKKPGSPLSRG